MFARLNLLALENFFSKKYTHAGRIVCGVRDTMEMFHGHGGGGLRTRVKEVRGSEVMRLLDNKANLHNRMKKNRLCGLMLY